MFPRAASVSPARLTSPDGATLPQPSTVNSHVVRTTRGSQASAMRSSNADLVTRLNLRSSAKPRLSSSSVSSSAAAPVLLMELRCKQRSRREGAPRRKASAIVLALSSASALCCSRSTCKSGLPVASAAANCVPARSVMPTLSSARTVRPGISPIAPTSAPTPSSPRGFPPSSRESKRSLERKAGSSVEREGGPRLTARSSSVRSSRRWSSRITSSSSPDSPP
eukprot:scaffold1116_cov31-Tisochrysis_lutea.AAC.4